MNTIFEGTEKKLEIFVNNPDLSLREDPFLDWNSLLQICHATILSYHHFKDVSEYLLSESSLFIYDSQIILITCGQTPLYKLIDFFFQHWSEKRISSIFYSRKNFFSPHQQLSIFEKEIASLIEYFPKKNWVNYRFGSANNDHMHVFFGSLKNIEQKDSTFELLMEGIPVEILELFRFEKKKAKVEKIRSFFSLQQFFPDLVINDHCFSPRGYSLNGVFRGQAYCTIHVSPEEEGSYISFETNILLNDYSSIMNHFLKICRPSLLMTALFSNAEGVSIENISENYTIVEKHFSRINNYDICLSRLKKNIL